LESEGADRSNCPRCPSRCATGASVQAAYWPSRPNRKNSFGGRPPAESAHWDRNFGQHRPIFGSSSSPTTHGLLGCALWPLGSCRPNLRSARSQTPAWRQTGKAPSHASSVRELVGADRHEGPGDQRGLVLRPRQILAPPRLTGAKSRFVLDRPLLLAGVEPSTPPTVVNPCQSTPLIFGTRWHKSRRFRDREAKRAKMGAKSGRKPPPSSRRFQAPAKGHHPANPRTHWPYTPAARRFARRAAHVQRKFPCKSIGGGNCTCFEPAGQDGVSRIERGSRPCGPGPGLVPERRGSAQKELRPRDRERGKVESRRRSTSRSFAILRDHLRDPSSGTR